MSAIPALVDEQKNLGQFVEPSPAKVEEMCMPETFGRSGMDIIKLE